MNSNPLLVALQKHGRYTKVSKIGAGGYGTVLKAIDTQDKEKYTEKVTAAGKTTFTLPVSVDPETTTVRVNGTELGKAEYEVQGPAQQKNIVRLATAPAVGAELEVEFAVVVAIKALHDVNKSLKRAKAAVREVKLMQFCSAEPHITGLRECWIDDDAQVVFIVQECMDLNLNHVIHYYKKTKNTTLSPEHVRYIVFCLLSGVRSMHDRGIIHRDLKPDNILVRNNPNGMEVKLCDFGMARFVNDNMTDLVCTVWYRAPELLTRADIYQNTFSHYSKSIDMWSVGCIVAEVLTLNPLFRIYDQYSKKDKLKPIVQLLAPTEEDLAHIPMDARPVRDEAGLNVDSLLEKHVAEKVLDADGVDFLKKVLAFHPGKRLTVHEALMHPYIKDIPYNTTSAPTTTNPDSQAKRTAMLEVVGKLEAALAGTPNQAAVAAACKDLQQFVPECGELLATQHVTGEVPKDSPPLQPGAAPTAEDYERLTLYCRSLKVRPLFPGECSQFDASFENEFLEKSKPEAIEAAMNILKNMMA